jgi:hypothetical protein
MLSRLSVEPELWRPEERKTLIRVCESGAFMLHNMALREQFETGACIMLVYVFLCTRKPGVCNSCWLYRNDASTRSIKRLVVENMNSLFLCFGKVVCFGKGNISKLSHWLYLSSRKEVLISQITYSHQETNSAQRIA